MVEFRKNGINNIVCIQPFACLANHIVLESVIKIRKEYKESNIVAIDYDPGASEVNQLNRIKLMLSTAQKNLSKVQENNGHEPALSEKHNTKNAQKHESNVVAASERQSGNDKSA